jgi:hypothetical protein
MSDLRPSQEATLRYLRRVLHFTEVEASFVAHLILEHGINWVPDRLLLPWYWFVHERMHDFPVGHLH